MLYVGLVLLSLVSCMLAFAIEIVKGNVRHIKNRRLPNAGAALFPTVPFIPAAYVLAAWGVNTLRIGLGYWVVAAYSVVSMAVRFRVYRRSRAELDALKNSGDTRLA
jgi:hypothetical protein